MDLRRIARGTVEWDRLEQIARALAERYDRPEVRVEFLEADNWLSTPLVVDEEFFVKVLSPQNSLVHAIFTSARNLGAVTSGNGPVFDHFGTPLEMAEHELEATRRMREAGVGAPKPVDAFEVDGLGVLVLEYLHDFATLDELPDDELRGHAPGVFEALATLHAEGLAHGDLRAENVLVRGGDLYFIDATTVRDGTADPDHRGISDAEAYDLACAVAMFAPRLGARAAVEAALAAYAPESLLRALAFMDFVRLRPDHDFDAAQVKGEIEKAAA